ncbi:MAG: hypothetical protein EFT35_07750 [Methanophagales archaeon ANME-1-THS]|nr:MAG: hypothetical protein EFT35_07750 [Methanophagales archaeon ANME-1-THS]
MVKIYKLIKDRNNNPVFSQIAIESGMYREFLQKEREEQKKEREQAQKKHEKIETPELRICEYCGKPMEMKRPWQKYHPECKGKAYKKRRQSKYIKKKQELKETKKEQYQEKHEKGKLSDTIKQNIFSEQPYHENGRTFRAK